MAKWPRVGDMGMLGFRMVLPSKVKYYDCLCYDYCAILLFCSP